MSTVRVRHPYGTERFWSGEDLPLLGKTESVLRGRGGRRIPHSRNAILVSTEDKDLESSLDVRGRRVRRILAKGGQFQNLEGGIFNNQIIFN